MERPAAILLTNYFYDAPPFAVVDNIAPSARFMLVTGAIFFKPGMCLSDKRWMGAPDFCESQATPGCSISLFRPPSGKTQTQPPRFTCFKSALTPADCPTFIGIIEQPLTWPIMRRIGRQTGWSAKSGVTAKRIGFGVASAIVGPSRYEWCGPGAMIAARSVAGQMLDMDDHIEKAEH